MPDPKKPRKLPRPAKKRVLAALVIAAVAAVGVARLVSEGEAGETVAVTLPPLSGLARTGQQAFGAVCAQCHGPNAGGSDSGPPLIHKLYHPGHHGDRAFVMAAKRGSRQHHWKFGNMPAQSEVSDDEIASIIAFVRELQAANGIF